MSKADDFHPSAPFQQVITSGQFKTEKDAVIRLSSILKEMSLFTIYNEVCGEYEYIPHFKDSSKSPRLDFLLTPTESLINLGWKFGAIGIECKKSGVKIGKALSQVIDYSRAVFRLPRFNVLVKPDFFFLWPCDKIHGDIASLMAQNRFGSLCETYPDEDYRRLNSFCGETKVFSYSFQDKSLEINQKFNTGKRIGSR